MQDLIVPASESTPAIEGNCSDGSLSIRGESYPENAFELYRPVIKWIEHCLERVDRPFRLRLDLLYLNTSSVRAMMEILDLMEQAFRAGQNVAVEWRYEPENERVVELAEEFREDYALPFAIVPKG